MKTIANILWFLFVGIWYALAYCLIGLLLCITIIGIPFGLQCFKFAKLMLFPFGKTVNTRFDSHPIANVLWFLFFGWESALSLLILGVLLCVTIIGIPCGLQCFKFAKLTLFPFGATIRG